MALMWMTFIKIGRYTVARTKREVRIELNHPWGSGEDRYPFGLPEAKRVEIGFPSGYTRSIRARKLRTKR
jgi:hypothetical protein